MLLLSGALTTGKVAENINNWQKIGMVWEMGSGINLGNELDVKGLRERHPEATIEEFETYWGNPQVTRQAIHSIAQRGFGTVRVPVSWAEHMDENGVIDPAWMERVTEVVSQALEADLYVVLNTHHEDWLVPTERREAEVTEKLRFVWQQIAENFRDYGDHLLFEGMNEPRVVGSKEEWKGGTAETREVVNRLNAVFVETVRETGGANANRWLLIPSYAADYERVALEALKMPEDDRLIVSVHAYLPYGFALDEYGTDRWDAERESDTEKIDTLMEDLDELFLRKGIPVIITEFSCHDKDNERERREWAEYYKRAADRKRIPCIWWDNGKDSKLFDRCTGEWYHHDMVDILVKNFRNP